MTANDINGFKGTRWALNCRVWSNDNTGRSRLGGERARGDWLIYQEDYATAEALYQRIRDKNSSLLCDTREDCLLRGPLQQISVADPLFGVFTMDRYKLPITCLSLLNITYEESVLCTNVRPGPLDGLHLSEVKTLLFIGKEMVNSSRCDAGFSDDFSIEMATGEFLDENNQSVLLRKKLNETSKEEFNKKLTACVNIANQVRAELSCIYKKELDALQRMLEPKQTNERMYYFRIVAKHRPCSLAPENWEETNLSEHFSFDDFPSSTDVVSELWTTDETVCQRLESHFKAIG